ncbi:hypothetical protein EJD97_005273, partial [Solanum chilense]
TQSCFLLLFQVFKYFVFLMNEASFNHGEREALRSCIKALNFWATEIWWELQDFTLNILKRIIDELIINVSLFQKWALVQYGEL